MGALEKMNSLSESSEVLFFKWDFEKASEECPSYWTLDMAEIKDVPLYNTGGLEPNNGGFVSLFNVGMFIDYSYHIEDLIPITKEEAEAMIIMLEMK